MCLYDNLTTHHLKDIDKCYNKTRNGLLFGWGAGSKCYKCGSPRCHNYGEEKYEECPYIRYQPCNTIATPMTNKYINVKTIEKIHLINIIQVYIIQVCMHVGKHTYRHVCLHSGCSNVNTIPFQLQQLLYIFQIFFPNWHDSIFLLKFHNNQLNSISELELCLHKIKSHARRPSK